MSTYSWKTTCDTDRLQRWFNPSECEFINLVKYDEVSNSYYFLFRRRGRWYLLTMFQDTTTVTLRRAMIHEYCSWANLVEDCPSQAHKHYVLGNPVEVSQL